MNRPSDLQIYYQRNLLYGLLSTILLTAAAGVWLSGIGGSNSLSQSQATAAGLIADIIDQPATTDRRNQAFFRQLHPYVDDHAGFLGFVRLRPAGQILAVPDALQSYVPAEELHPEFSHEELPTLVASAGSVDGFMMSPGDYYALGTYKNGPKQLLADREVEVVLRFDPEYPFVARDAGKEGEVSVLVYIDSNGELASFPSWLIGDGIRTLQYTLGNEHKTFQYAINEKPTDWFFATNLLKVLPTWVFTPRIESGITVSSLLRIRFNFCLGVNCLRLELEHVQSIQGTDS